LAKKVISQVRFETSQIDDLFESYSNLLLKIQQEKPDLIETTAIASVLHSFYNGLENIFLCIAKKIDQNIPKGDLWHRDLLYQMEKKIPERSPVLTNDTIRQLADYMAFRHFFRHSYSFTLEWKKLKKLITSAEGIWQKTKNELELFLNSLEESEE
jgi:hypothetical protein